VARQKQVFGLQVAMHHAFFVGRGERVEHLVGDR
jgi:hypothetical protein